MFKRITLSHEKTLQLIYKLQEAWQEYDRLLDVVLNDIEKKASVEK